MAINDVVPHTHEIRLNGKSMLRGDRSSAFVTYYNLTGRNFAPPSPSWREGKYESYLTLMERDFGVSFSGKKMEVAEIGKGAIHTYQFPFKETDTAVCPPDWSPVFTKYRHGGWYVMNVQYPSGACGCVSNNYPDGKWRVVSDNRRINLGEEGDITFPSRDAAARAEYVLAMQENNQQPATHAVSG